MRILKFLDRWRFPIPFVYSDDYWMLNVGPHVFPIKKYRALYEKLLLLGARKTDFLAPEPASDEDILLVHSARYVKKLKTASLSSAEIAMIELPFSMELVHFAWLMTGGTILTARLALERGLAVHLGGGFHHAFHDHGEGFCVLNDVAVAVETLKKNGAAQRIMVVDCDLHQGNGTAHILSGKDYAFTFSIHQMDLYPSLKPPSTVDIGLWAGEGDEGYLAALRSHFPRLYREYRPDLVIYLAGADPYEKDQLGSLRLTKEGLRRRDIIVIGEARRLRLPVAVVLAGGYAVELEDTVDIHLNTIRAAQKVQRKFSQPFVSSSIQSR
ncbi:MAG: histone deacetylase superfamily [Candidatus Aminicenantes bacterium]|nr:histone deacetylase superfamily [Candidatus Aminicenantes bacterium]